jgi:hypothetical protein
MTIEKLIDELMKFPLDTSIMIDNGDGAVNIDEIEWDNYYGYTRKVIIK